jgi:hypothetical protein
MEGVLQKTRQRFTGLFLPSTTKEHVVDVLLILLRSEKTYR